MRWFEAAAPRYIQCLGWQQQQQDGKCGEISRRRRRWVGLAGAIHPWDGASSPNSNCTAWRGGRIRSCPRCPGQFSAHGPMNSDGKKSLGTPVLERSSPVPQSGEMIIHSIMSTAAVPLALWIPHLIELRSEPI